jgi:quercetin dioxygenase-like cupin family protein
MRVIHFFQKDAQRISEFQSHGAFALPVASGVGEFHIYQLYFEAGGQIGPHPAGFDQLFTVLSGSGWIS